MPSSKTIYQFSVTPFSLTVPLHFENCREAGGIVIPYIRNSILVSGATWFGVVLIGSLTAYVFAQFQFPGKEILYYLVLILLMVPGILTLVPGFVVVRDLNLLNTRWALILPWIAGGQVFAIFNILGTWNDFLWPLITISNEEVYPLVLGLFDCFDSSRRPTPSGDRSWRTT